MNKNAPLPVLCLTRTGGMKWCLPQQGLIMWKHDDITTELQECQDISTAVLRHVSANSHCPLVLPPCLPLPPPCCPLIKEWSHDTNQKTTQVSKENKISQLLSASIETRINLCYSRVTERRLSAWGYIVYCLLWIFHLTGILEAVILIKSQLTQIMHLKRNAVLRNLAELVNHKSSESL